MTNKINYFSINPSRILQVNNIHVHRKFHNVLKNQNESIHNANGKKLEDLEKKYTNEKKIKNI